MNNHFRFFNLHALVSDDLKFRNLVVWLEDTRIRRYSPSARAPLRRVDDPKWSQALRKYFSDLGIPESHFSAQEPRTQLLCLLNLAVKTQFMTKPDEQG